MLGAGRQGFHATRNNKGGRLAAMNFHSWSEVAVFDFLSFWIRIPPARIALSATIVHPLGTPLHTKLLGARDTRLRTAIPPAASIKQSTIIVSDQADHDFCRDFSVLLRDLPLSWVILEQDELPESTRDMNIVFAGTPDSSHAAPLLEKYLAPVLLQRSLWG